MSANGRRRPPRPRLEVEGTATPEEAAAIAAALERFLAETAAVAAPASPRSRWQSAALREGVERAPVSGRWGGGA